MSESPPTISSLIDVLARLRPASSRSTLRGLLEHGRVRVNGVIVKVARMPIAPDDRVEIIDAQPAPVRRLPFPVVYQDDDCLVIDKPAGLLTSTTPNEKRPTALAIVREFIAQTMPRAKVGLIHRLDRDASGLLIFSLSREGFDSLKRQFFDHSAGRVYAAIVSGTMAETKGSIESRLVEYVDGTVHSTKMPGRGQEAVTHYQVTSVNKDYTLLRVSLETGRKHQIRAHLAEFGHPIMGDSLYSGVAASRLMLAGIELSFAHPRTGKKVRFTAPLPEPLAGLMRH